MKKLESLSELISIAFSESNEPVKVELGKMSQEQAQCVKEAVGLSVEDFEHTVDSYALKHAIRKHGSPAAEASRGQVAVGASDFILIPTIIQSPDSVSYAGINNLGNHVLIYAKTVGEQVFYLEEIRAKRKEAAMQTMYKRKAPTQK